MKNRKTKKHLKGGTRSQSRRSQSHSKSQSHSRRSPSHSKSQSHSRRSPIGSPSHSKSRRSQSHSRRSPIGSPSRHSQSRKSQRGSPSPAKSLGRVGDLPFYDNKSFNKEMTELRKKMKVSKKFEKLIKGVIIYLQATTDKNFLENIIKNIETRMTNKQQLVLIELFYNLLNDKRKLKEEINKPNFEKKFCSYTHALHEFLASITDNFGEGFEPQIGQRGGAMMKSVSIAFILLGLFFIICNIFDIAADNTRQFGRIVKNEGNEMMGFAKASLKSLTHIVPDDIIKEQQLKLQKAMDNFMGDLKLLEGVQTSASSTQVQLPLSLVPATPPGEVNKYALAFPGLSEAGTTGNFPVKLEKLTSFTKAGFGMFVTEFLKAVDTVIVETIARRKEICITDTIGTSQDKTINAPVLQKAMDVATMVGFAWLFDGDPLAVASHERDRIQSAYETCMSKVEIDRIALNRISQTLLDRGAVSKKHIESEFNYLVGSWSTFFKGGKTLLATMLSMAYLFIKINRL